MFKIGKTRLCRNNCVFCFVDQLPQGVRPTLCEKDDDWRMSFLYGNYVTFTNVPETQIQQIIKHKYSPMYVSVHAADPLVRLRLMRCKSGLDNVDIMPLLRRFKENGITVHGQAVLCPGINDGAQLVRTIEELHGLIKTLAVVPVGLTKYQKHAGLRPVTPAIAAGIIDTVEGFSRKYLAEDGSRFVWCADEFYALSGRELPGYDTYEGFAQIDNGVGIVSALKFEFTAALDSLSEETVPLDLRGAADIATGVSAYPYITELCGAFKGCFKGAGLAVHKITNSFFGESVTVAGLVAGADIAAQAKGRLISDTLLIPDTMLKADSDLFLDDMTVSGLQKELSTGDKSVKVVPVPVNGEAFVRELYRACRQ